MTQIIAGRAARRSIQVPPGRRTRPTLARVREAMFSALNARFGAFDGLRVLDAFAGSGALGLEAWSRGADEVILIEAHPPTCRLISKNIETLGANKECSIRRGRCPAALKSLSGTFDIILLDPPYGDTALHSTLDALLEHNMFAPDAIIVVEHATRDHIKLPQNLELLKQSRYGDTSVTLLGFNPPINP